MIQRYLPAGVSGEIKGAGMKPRPLFGPGTAFRTRALLTETGAMAIWQTGE